ncbi:hypothetical protein SAMN04487944_1072 [Gracilibacillus ureilyticus]|uniref:DUF2071 domain-containing protein n=1 Tax=Gracilibacillus ureilyticus TaxID=531814 RepID=A0A1H9QJZ1_9BACI|nr:DUF2071 domain-containing protein [Gracilibacillus ureilyticus]SER60738.1 hypothetical protein SAMN04487944_1072 [Gracilibacillus ureilyticus]
MVKKRYQEILNMTDHRTHQLPEGPWLMTQRWDHLLFIHLPVEKEIMEANIPNGLELDIYEGTAWITILPFRIRDMHFRKIPPIPFLQSFLELNVRTYVQRNGVKGIYFFSLDANKLPAVLGARMASLPYVYSNMKMEREKDTYYYMCSRKGSSKEFRASYRPFSNPFYPEKNSLSYWLLERYYLWASRNKSLYSGGIHHMPWRIQQAEVAIEEENILPDMKGINLTGNPIYQYCFSKRVLFWPIKKVK